tara:strand:- start:2609 stop:3586 length:978 start_codon:yes stop_codon:yes gene_type:complete
VKKKNLLFRFDFKRKKNLSYGHLLRALKIISNLTKNHNIFYLIKTEINSKDKFFYLKKKNLIQRNKSLYFNDKLFKKKIDFLIIDLPYKDKKINFLNEQIKKKIVIEDHFKNYNYADYYFTNLKLKKKQIKKISLKKDTIFHGNEYFINDQKKTKFKPKKNIKNIFVNFGGSDPLNLTRKFISKIKDNNLQNYIFHVVLGPGARKISNNKTQTNCKIYHNLSTKKFNALRIKSDIAIVTGGNVLIENVFLGLPSLAFSSSSYESKIIKQLGKIRAVNEFRGKDFTNMYQKIISFNFQKRIETYIASKNLIKINKFHSKLKIILDH